MPSHLDRPEPAHNYRDAVHDHGDGEPCTPACGAGCSPSAVLDDPTGHARHHDGAATGPTSFECPRCHAVSHGPCDVAQGYCARCDEWTGGGAITVTAIR